MRIMELYRNNKLYFSGKDISDMLSINAASAKVTASRYVKQGLLLRLKRDFYTTPGRFDNLIEEEAYTVANILQTPSYVSLVTALSYYSISTQQQRYYIESISLKRTMNISIREYSFTYTRLKRVLYSGFGINRGKSGYFIAMPDKAMADIAYLCSLGRYKCDFEAIDFGKINKKSVFKFLEKSNKSAIQFWEMLCANYRI
ncbi:MAG TPA: hypothetical protein VI583_05720 [Cyclobacteriaceae bacterium]|nr:hypothetical protein [Cyclobacteriaceae bacterium]